MDTPNTETHLTKAETENIPITKTVRSPYAKYGNSENSYIHSEISFQIGGTIGVIFYAC